MNKNYTILTFVDGDFSIDIRFDVENDTIWMTQKEIASVFEVTADNISLHIKNIFNDHVFDGSVSEEYSVTASDGKRYNTKIYNLEIITLLSYKVRSKRAPTFISWAKETIQELKQNQLIEINNSCNNLLLCNNYSCVPYKTEKGLIFVRISTEEKTVWLTQREISKLYSVSKEDVRRHIKKIYRKKEQLEATTKKWLAVDIINGKEVSRNVAIYNLKIIVAVGFRTNSVIGTQFRTWAAEELNNILVNQYNETPDIKKITNKILKVEENITSIQNTLTDLSDKISVLFDDNIARDNALFFKEEKEKAHIMITGIFAQAKESIVVIDPYMDNTIISYLNETSNHVKWTLITSFNKKKLNEADIKRIEQYYDNVSFNYDEDIHDRFILLDNEKLFCIGSSIKDIPTGLSAIIRIYSKNIINELVEFIKNHSQK